MPDANLEANYHFTLSAMMDLIETYGYCNVLNDLDAMIEDKLNTKVNLSLNTDGVPVLFEERN